MKLRSISVNQFKKFTTPQQLKGIKDGLNVIVGPNELGKSTLLDAIRAAFFEKHSSKAQQIVALQNDRNKAAPVVELEFELEDGVYSISKRFLKKPFARLSCPDGSRLEGEAAEEKMRQLLDFDEPGNKGIKAESLGMWSVLWVQQGRSFESIDLTDSARSSLHFALESEVGEVLGGRRGRELPDVIERQLNELVTGKGKKPRGEYKSSIEQVETFRDELDELQERRRNLNQTLDDLEDAQRSLKRLADGDSDREDQEEVEETRKRRSQLVELEALITAASTELQLKQKEYQYASQARSVRARLRSDIQTENTTLEDAGKELSKTRENLKQAKSQVDALRVQVREIEEEVVNAEVDVSRHRRVLTNIDRQSQLREIEERLKKAEAAGEREKQAQKAAAAILVTDGLLTEIRNATRELDSVESRLDSAATVISFQMPPESLTGIEVDGRHLSGSEPSIRAVEPISIAIPSRGHISVEPAIKNRDELIQRKQDAQIALKNVLENAGVPALLNAEEENAKLKRLLQDADFARQEVELHASSTDEYEAGVQGLTVFIDGLQKILTRELEELEVRQLPTRIEAEASLRTAVSTAEELRAQLGILRASQSGPQERYEAIQTEIKRRQSKYDECKSRLDLLKSQLGSAEEEHSDDTLSDAVETASSALRKQEGILERLNEKRSNETLAQLEARIERLENAIKERQAKRGALNERIAGLKSRVDVAEGAGIDEAIERKARELDIANEKTRRMEHDVNVLSLLLATLHNAEREAKERYLAPVLNRVRPNLRVLFPGAEILIDEDLHVTSIVREEGYEETFSHLSIGTQEQIAVLVRLAFAEMLVQRGQPATVILDDALVFSDDQRMTKIFDILNMTAKRVQVIVFTCREQLFERLGGRQLSLEAVNSDKLISA